MLFQVAALLQLSSMVMSAGENNFLSEEDEIGRGTDYGGDEDEFGNNRIARICSRTCNTGTAEECVAQAEDQCSQQCQAGTGQIVWDYNTCGLDTGGVTEVPTITYTQWMNQIQQLQFGKKELCQCEKYARTKPEELIAFLNTIFIQKSRRTEGLKQIFARIVSNVDRYISKSDHIVSDAVRSIQAKIISWKLEIKRISQKRQLQEKTRHLITIISSAGSAMDCFPIIEEIKLICGQDDIQDNVRTDLEILLLDIKQEVLKQKISYLLTSYDQMIEDEIKLRLSEMIIAEIQINQRNQIEEQYEKMIEYVTTLINGNSLTGQINSELRMICTKLGVEGFMVGGGFIEKYISFNELIEKLSSSSRATFDVSSIEDCNDNFCDYRILDSVCTYGSRCSVSAVQRGRAVVCTVMVRQCLKSSPVPQLKTQDVINLLQSKQYAETVCFSSSACYDLCSLETSTFGFGGIGCKINWDRNTKKCSLQIRGMRQVDNWLDKECGKGCRFDQLEYLGLEQVGRAAIQGDGVRFKTPDEISCKQYCDQGVGSSSACKGSFTCSHHCKCWPGSCVCTVKHTCHSSSGLGLNRNMGEYDQEQGNDNVEETITLPRVMPVVNESENFIKRENVTSS